MLVLTYDIYLYDLLVPVVGKLWSTAQLSRFENYSGAEVYEIPPDFCLRFSLNLLLII